MTGVQIFMLRCITGNPVNASAGFCKELTGCLLPLNSEEQLSSFKEMAEKLNCDYDQAEKIQTMLLTLQGQMQTVWCLLPLIKKRWWRYSVTVGYRIRRMPRMCLIPLWEGRGACTGEYPSEESTYWNRRGIHWGGSGKSADRQTPENRWKGISDDSDRDWNRSQRSICEKIQIRKNGPGLILARTVED